MAAVKTNIPVVRVNERNVAPKGKGYLKVVSVLFIVLAFTYGII